MNRVTEEIVKEAFEMAEMIPAATSYLKLNDQNKVCGCVFTAIYCKVKGITGSNLLGLHMCMLSEALESTLSDTYESDYMFGFMSGFDYIEEISLKRRAHKSNSTKWVEGIDDGMKIRKFIIETYEIELEAHHE